MRDEKENKNKMMILIRSGRDETTVLGETGAEVERGEQIA